MSREIKFRAWDISSRTMFYNHSVTISISGVISFLETNCEWIEPDNGRVILMQSTGLKDKNRKKIYEGDILRFGKTSSSVVWCLDGWRFNSYMEMGLLNLYNYVNPTTGKEVAEVIGNIYENPELVK